jgi:UTP--glucose-1-phosphate uridylyltransferase
MLALTIAARHGRVDRVPPADAGGNRSVVEIKKAIITAAGKAQATLPLQTLLDRDGTEKTALRILIEEALSAGIEEICVVIRTGDEPAYRLAADDLVGRLRFVEQPAPLGYGHAVLCAREFTGSAPFLLLVSDHLYLHHGPDTCARQLVAIATAQDCSVSAVQATHESKLPYYGAVGGKRIGHQGGLYQVDHVIEKPTPTEAEQTLIVPGLRSGSYLCFFGMHVLSSRVMDRLADLAPGTDNLQLTTALQGLVGRERYLAAELHGRRFDIGVRYGLLTAQLALALDGRDRDEVLIHLVELLAQRSR